MEKTPTNINIFNTRKDKKLYLKNINPMDLIDLIKYIKWIDDKYLPILIEELKVLINKNQYNKHIILAIDYSKSYNLFNYLTEDELLKLNPYYKQNGNSFCHTIDSYLYHYTMYFLKMKNADEKFIKLIDVQKKEFCAYYHFFYFNIIKNFKRNILCKGINYIIIKAFCTLNDWAFKKELVDNLDNWFIAIDEHKDLVCKDKKLLLKIILIFMNKLLLDKNIYHYYINQLIDMMQQDISDISINKNILNYLTKQDREKIKNIQLNKKIYKKLLKG